MSDKQYEPTYEGQLDKCQDERHALQMQLEEYIEAFKFAHKEFHEALDDLAKMKAERDEARRETMLLLSDRASTKEMNAEYKKRGWEYLKKNTDA